MLDCVFVVYMCVRLDVCFMVLSKGYIYGFEVNEGNNEDTLRKALKEQETEEGREK